MPKHQTIDHYIAGCDAAVVPLLNDLRAYIAASLPGATEGMKYGAPCFYNAKGAKVIYLFGSRDHVNFGFLRSAELSDPDGLLTGSGKPSKHIKLQPGQPLDTATLDAFVRQCADLDP